jgi:hypothetical protein
MTPNQPQLQQGLGTQNTGTQPGGLTTNGPIQGMQNNPNQGMDPNTPPQSPPPQGNPQPQ